MAAATMQGAVKVNSMLVFGVVAVFLFASSFLINPVIAAHSDSIESQAEKSIVNLSARKLQFQEDHGKSRDENTKDMLIGSTAPTCSYNECKGCRYRCRAEQIPVDGNDPVNSAYRYKCVCHR